MPKTRTARVWFEACNCGKSGPHGYFYDEGKRCPWPTTSMETANSLLNAITEDKSLMAEEVAKVRVQIAAARLPERMSEEEREMLIGRARDAMLRRLVTSGGGFFMGST